MSDAEYLVRYALVGACWIFSSWRVSRIASAAFAELRAQRRRATLKIRRGVRLPA